jgi:hypothetical protein
MATNFGLFKIGELAAKTVPKPWSASHTAVRPSLDTSMRTTDRSAVASKIGELAAKTVTNPKQTQGAVHRDTHHSSCWHVVRAGAHPASSVPTAPPGCE